MRPWLRYGLLGLGAYLVFLVALAPAHSLRSFLPAEVRVAGVTGSVWKGHAARIEYKDYRAEDVDWRLASPYRLLLAQLPWRLRIERGSISGFTDFVVSPTGLALEDSDLNINLRILENALSAYRIRLGGQPVRLLAETLQAHREGPGAASGNLRWEHATVRAPVALSLGTMTLALEDADGTWIGTLSNDSEQIRIEGTIRVARGWAWSSEIRLAAGPKADATLRQALPLLGRPDRNGVVTLKGSGQLFPNAAPPG